MQPREWIMLVLLIAIPLAIAVVVTLWSIKQMAYKPKKAARPKPVLSADDLARLSGEAAGADRDSVSHFDQRQPGDVDTNDEAGSDDTARRTAGIGPGPGSRAGSV